MGSREGHSRVGSVVDSKRCIHVLIPGTCEPVSMTSFGKKSRSQEKEAKTAEIDRERVGGHEGQK